MRQRVLMCVVGVMAVIGESGCALPLAWINPPLQASVEGGGRSGGGSAEPLVGLDVTVRPLKGYRKTVRFPVDPGVGVLLQTERLRHLREIYPYGTLDATVLEWGQPKFWEGGELQLAVGALLEDPEEFKVTPTATVRLQTGARGFLESEEGGDCNSSQRAFLCGFGVGHGQTGMDLYAETTWMRLRRRDIWQVGVGLKVRIPASMGAGFLIALP